MTQSGYFIIGTIVAFGMVITYAKLIFYQSIAGNNRYKYITTIEYNDWVVFGCFNNPFLADCVTPDFNFPPIAIDDSPHLEK